MLSDNHLIKQISCHLSPGNRAWITVRKHVKSRGDGALYGSREMSISFTLCKKGVMLRLEGNKTQIPFSHHLDDNIQQDVVGLPDALGKFELAAVYFTHFEHICRVPVFGKLFYGLPVQVLHVVDQKL